jgi:glucose-specific phosphotransferase system IIA component
MGLFHKIDFKKKVIVAPQTGRIISVGEIPDPVFSGKVLGDGIGIIPSESKVLAPVSGTVVQIADTLHAICIQSDDGLEVLIHLGLNTVSLKGKGFKCHVKSGQHVSTGDLLMDMDIGFIQNEGLNVVTPCIITNMDIVKKLSTVSGSAVAGKTAVMEYNL